MYDIKKITTLVEEKIRNTGIFIVEIKNNSGNKINIFLDSGKGIQIDDCVEISRYIESNLNRDEEDFELEVSSAGIGLPFKVEKQYLKNIEKDVEVLMTTGEKLKGVLKNYNLESIDLEIEKKVRKEGKKKKELIKELLNIQIKNIKSTKQILSI